MIILITGASHAGKTALAQKLLEQYKYPYLSIDLLKMGLIRSGNTTLTPVSDECQLTNYLWPIVCEMIKTAVENKQNLIVEGCYIPFDWSKDFEPEYLENIKYYCLVMSDRYIRNHFDDIKKYANIVENRMDDEDCTIESVCRDNAEIWNQCQKYKVKYILIDEEYQIDIELRMEYVKLFWKHNFSDEPVVIFYEVNLENERSAIRSIDIFADGKTKNIDNLYERTVPEGLR